MKNRIEEKIKQIKHDIEAIKNGEMLSIYNAPIDKKMDEEQSIRLQEWRIKILHDLRYFPADILARKLKTFEENQIAEKSFETAVLIDLYKIALGVL